MSSHVISDTNEVQCPDRLKNVFFKLGSHVLKFENVEIDQKDKEKARKELRETPEIMRESLKTFRKLLTAEPYLNYPTDDDQKLLIFLRVCKHYPESALDKIKKFYNFKYEHPEFSYKLTPCNEKRAFLQNLLTILPYRTKDGERVVIIQAGEKWDTESCRPEEIFRSGMLILEIAMEEPKTQINGVRIIIDVNGLTMQHVWQFSVAFARHAGNFIKECLPLRLKGVHFVNQPIIFNILYTLFQSFVGDKIRKRFTFHGTDYKSLHNHISPSILPKEFGGDLDIPLDAGKALHQYLTKFEPEFQERTFYGYSENYRT